MQIEGYYPPTSKISMDKTLRDQRFFLFYIILRKPNPMTDNVSLFVQIFPSSKNAYLYVNRLHLPALCQPVPGVQIVGARKNKSEGGGEVREETHLSPQPPLLFIAFFTLHRSPLSERLEQASPLRAAFYRRATETRACVKITPREKRRHAARKEKNK